MILALLPPMLAGVAQAAVPEVVIPARVARIEKLPAELEARVGSSIDMGVDYLRRSQFKPGTWSPGGKPQKSEGQTDGRYWAVGYAAMPALALLHAGVPAKDPAVQRAAGFVRTHVLDQTRTYEIALAILFLDRLGDPADKALIRSLGLRLAAGQGALGGWGYNCPLLTREFEGKFQEGLRTRKASDVARLPRPPELKAKSVKASDDRADNSNTQFAVLGLWVARNYCSVTR